MGKELRAIVHGLFTALITPFDSHGMIDEDGIADLVRFQISKGVDGLFPCGSTGLGPLLKLDERKKVAEAVIKEASGKVPVVVQVGCADTESTVELAKHAEKSGAQAVASLTPYYYKPGDIAVMKHFERIGGSIDVPLFAYNIPQFTGNALRPQLIEGLARNGTISGIKDSTKDIVHLLDILSLVRDEIVIMNGAEEYALFSLMMGCDGIVSGGASALPELFSDVVNAQKGHDYKAGIEIQRAILNYKDSVGPNSIASYYEILKERGVDCGKPRGPVLPLAKEESRKLMKRLRSLGFPANGK